MAEIRPYSFIKPAPVPEAEAEPVPAFSAGPDLSRLSFLVIDSVTDMRVATCSMLNEFGAGNVDYAARSGDALGMLRRKEYDVVLSEYDLGHGFDGLYLFEEARRHGILKASCVFMIVTAERRATRVIGAAELAPDAIVLKPYTGDMLYGKLVRAIRRKARLRPIDEAVLAHDFLRAIHLCEAEIEAGGDDATSFLRMKVHLLLRIGDWAAARDLCREVLAQADLPWARMALGKSLYHLGSHEEARTVFQGVIAEHELVMEAYDWLAKSQSAGGDGPGALETLRRAVARSPYVIGRQRDLGDVAWHNGDLATADAAISETVRLSRYSFWRDPGDYGRLAQVQIARGDTLGARRTATEIRREFKDAPAAAMADALDADIWLKHGDKIRARDALDQALHGLSTLLAPPPSEVGLVLAQACMNQQRFEVGEKIVRTVLKNRHDDAGLQGRVTTLFRQAGREEVASRLIEETNQDIVTLNNEAVRLAQSGELAAAAERFIKAVADMPANLMVLLNAINALLAFVNREGWHETYMRRAAEYLERVRELDQDNGRALQLAEIHRKTCQRFGRT
ncbi:CheY chemotaxis protein or a CheY-like REC (receiver) domain [Formivibrio citricus]|uniref:CheY chemotaxis protein or a CheY-like REC (Receiver) domain n=1 Tax=Formivibrio citricus TaxID=83765 RepID=A0A1I4VV60_9NEIS|nr:tetratricopeptide repeat protein [Formivibrio citricus]SFN04907.1 CheY chemotaxis protein or a CheY-like REC (receiver) domain [Formivibrio citricus]